MLRVGAVLGLALFVLGCGSAAQAGVSDAPSEPVRLLTGVNGCYAGGESSSGATGVLVPDPSYGTSIRGMPVMWPVGFTGVRVGSEVEVLDSTGNVVATTGKNYHMSKGPVSDPRAVESLGAFPAAANCGYAWDFMDCTLAPGSSPSYEYKLYCGFPEYWTCTTPAPHADPSDKYCRVRP